MNTQARIRDFTNFVTTKRRNGKDWAFLHAKSDGSTDISVGELEQTVCFGLQGNETQVIKSEDGLQIVILTHDRNRLALNIFNRAIQENFRSSSFQTTTNVLGETGLNQLAGFLGGIVPPDDEVSKVVLKRMVRISNTILVLDDDKMILKQMENVLKGFGHVELCQAGDQFLDLYKQYAPNIVFVDMHLKGVKGSDILLRVQEGIDPFVYSVMISSDTARETILEVKGLNVKGYVVKPFNRDQIYQHLLKAPSFVPKNALSNF